MLKVFARRKTERTITPKPPADPIELGFALRSARERLGMPLEQVRDSVGVPVVDLDSLERGHLEVLHSQQAALVALGRYASFLGLEPGELTTVVRAHWPNRGLALDAFASDTGFTPLAELEAAAQLLGPIANMPNVNLCAPQMGLSETTKLNLESGAARRIFSRQVLVATTADRPRLAAPATPALAAAPPQVESRLVSETASRISDEPAAGEPESVPSASDGVNESVLGSSGPLADTEVESAPQEIANEAIVAEAMVQPVTATLLETLEQIVSELDERLPHGRVEVRLAGQHAELVYIDDRDEKADE